MPVPQSKLEYEERVFGLLESHDRQVLSHELRVLV